MGAEAKQRFGVHAGGSGGTWCTHGTGVSLITGSQKSSQMRRGMGAVPGVTHLDFEESILLQ